MKEDIIQSYIDSETSLGKKIDQGNIDVIGGYEKWQTKCLEDDVILRLVMVDCEESKPLIINSDRLLESMAREAKRQMDASWQSKWNKAWIEDLILKFELGQSVCPIILREKKVNEPPEGSYYVQDGNHRMLAAAIFFINTGKFPDLTFHIGENN